MSSAAVQRTLRAAVQQRVFASAYYLHGDEEYLKEDAVRQLIAAAVDPATRDFNLEVRRGNELSAELLGSLLNTPPMMADRRMVVVRDVSGLRKDARTALDRYLDAPAPDTVVVLTTPAGSKADKKLADKAEALEFAPLSGDRVLKWIGHHASHELGVEITPAAAGLLQSAVGDDLPQLALELEKLASYSSHSNRPDAASGGLVIEESAVWAVVGVRKEETLGGLLDAVGQRDPARALALLPGVLLQPKTTAVSIVMALATQTIALAWAQTLRERGTPPSRLSGELFNLLKESGSTYTGRPWGEAVAAWARASDRWSRAELDDALDALLAADRSLKETRLSSDEQLLTTLVLTLCGARARSGIA